MNLSSKFAGCLPQGNTYAKMSYKEKVKEAIRDTATRPLILPFHSPWTRHQIGRGGSTKLRNSLSERKASRIRGKDIDLHRPHFHMKCKYSHGNSRATHVQCQRVHHTAILENISNVTLPIHIERRTLLRCKDASLTEPRDKATCGSERHLTI